MTPDEVVKVLSNLQSQISDLVTSTKAEECEQSLSSAISLIQDYQKLRERVSVEKIEKICFDHISIGTSEYYKMLPVNLAEAIVTYLQQPTEHITR
jgi:hypothetical protein